MAYAVGWVPLTGPHPAAYVVLVRCHASIGQDTGQRLTVASDVTSLVHDIVVP
jgi:hypothetical protein